MLNMARIAENFDPFDDEEDVENSASQIARAASILADKAEEWSKFD